MITQQPHSQWEVEAIPRTEKGTTEYTKRYDRARMSKFRALPRSDAQETTRFFVGM